MAPELRGEFHRELERLDISVAALLGVIPEAVVAATTALLVSDVAGASSLGRWQQLVGDLYADVERTVETVLARQAPMAGDLRFLMACVRIVPTLNDAVDLIADIAAPSRQRIGDRLPARLISLTEQLGELTSLAWQAVTELWERRDPARMVTLREHDDALAEVRSSLAAEVASGLLDFPAAMEMTLVGRSFERLGRLALSVGELIRPLCGSLPRA